MQSGSTTILIDGGVSVRSIRSVLVAEGLHFGSLSAVLVTHEHADHIRAFPRLFDYLDCPVFSTEGSSLHPALRTATVAAPGTTLEIGEVLITPIPITHDASEPVGFFLTNTASSYLHLLDLGCWNETHVQLLAQADVALIEANHDLDRLWSCRYPWALKERIASTSGHLSNDQCGALLHAAQLLRRRPQRIILGHLSDESNTPELAFQAVAARSGVTPHAVAIQKTGLLWVEAAPRPRVVGMAVAC